MLSRMGTTPQGLTAEEAAVRLRIVGSNLVAHERRQSLFAELVGRARNPLNFLLLSGWVAYARAAAQRRRANPTDRSPSRRAGHKGLEAFEEVGHCLGECRGTIGSRARCGIALVPFFEEPPFHNRDQEFESVFLQR
ncbi:MAG: cation-transporting P-type ATPase [Stellaceae bacterium]